MRFPGDCGSCSRGEAREQIMTREDELLFACIRLDFSDAQRRRIVSLGRQPRIQWEGVYETAALHDVAPLVYSNLRQCLGADFEIPAGVVAAFERDYFYNIAAKEQVAARIAQVLAFLNQAGVDVMLLKGSALDVLVYAHPWYTTANDVDLVFRLRQTEMQNPAVPRFLDGFADIHFEYDYFEHHDITMNGMLPMNFERIWADAREIDFRGHTVWVMSPEDLMIAACINSCRKRFFRLKALRDIAEILNHYRDIRWDVLADKARAYECGNIVYAALIATQSTLGIDLAPSALDGLAVPSPRAALIRYLSRERSFTSLANLYAGNRLFGREVGRGLLLPYATYRGNQLWKRMKFVSAPFEHDSPLG